MKKLAVFVMIPALAIFMVAALASAKDSGWGAIHGDYAMIATGSCLHSTSGFDASLTPITGEGSVVWGATTMAQALWTFKSDGTGTVSGTNYVLDFPPGSPVFSGPIARQNAIVFDFIYEVTHDGAITVWPPSPQPILVGMISTDHKTLTLGNANQIQPWRVGSVICNIGRVLIRVDK